MISDAVDELIAPSSIEEEFSYCARYAIDQFLIHKMDLDEAFWQFYGYLHGGSNRRVLQRASGEWKVI